MATGSKEEQIARVAEQVKVLIGLAAMLIPDKELLLQVANEARQNVEHAETMMRIVGARGGDMDRPVAEAILRSQRAQALYELINTIDRTEQKRQKFLRRERP